jgi:hypothetical protein
VEDPHDLARQVRYLLRVERALEVVRRHAVLADEGRELGR